MSGSEDIAKQVQSSYLNYKKIKEFEDVGYFLIPYVVSGGIVIKNIERNNMIDVSNIVASIDDDLVVRDGKSFKTTIANSTYYLDFEKDGDWSWDTSHPSGSIGTDYLTIATVTTDANKNVLVIMDSRGDTKGFRLKPDFMYPEIAALQKETVTGVYNANYNGLNGNGTTDNNTALSALLMKIGSSNATILFPPGTYKFSANITIPSNVTVWMLNGAMLSPKNGVTLTINGPLEAGLYQVFTGSGIIAGSFNNITGFTEWFGAKADGSNDDAPAFTKALNVFGAINLSSSKIYRINSNVNIPNGRTIFGNNAIIYGSASLTQMFTVNQSTDIHNINISGDSPTFTAFKVVDSIVNIVGCKTFNVGIAVESNSALTNIDRCYFRGANGVLFTNQMAEVRSISNTVIQVSGSGVPVTISGGAGTRISNCDLMGGTTNLMVNPTNEVVGSLIVTNTFFDQGSANCCALIHTGEVGGIVRSKFINCWFTGSSGGNGLLTSGIVKGLQLSNCDAYSCHVSGMAFNSGDFSLNNCNIAGNTGSGISIGVAVTDFSISGCTVAPCGDFGANLYGIYINTGANIYVVTGNNLHGNTNSGIVDMGGTTKVVTNNLL